jgi:Tfp pilus assembly protein PilF
MGKFTEAKDLRQRQLEIDPRHPLVRLYLARSLVELGETSRATIEVKKAREFESLLSTEGLNYLKSLEQKIQEVQNG